MGNKGTKDSSAKTEDPKESPAEQANVDKEGEAPPEPTPQPETTEAEGEPAKQLVELNDIKNSLKTGDLLLLYRKDAEFPNYAILVDNSANEEYFPLLMVKGSTKPMSKDNFSKRRYLTAVTAVTRIFYGDYERVAVCRLTSDQKDISAKKALDTVDQVDTEKYSEDELKLIDEAETDPIRSVMVSVLNLSVLYSKLGIIGEPVTPSSVKDIYKTWNTTLPVGEPTFINVPPIKPGPMKGGTPPFYQKIL